MISAFTHVGGDTLRTVSVLIAAMISTIGGINADVCDAWAAIAVSVTIIALLTPLMGNIFKEFKIIRRESNDYAPVEFDDDDENDALVI
jgi:Co/Zn/Cd efflux system component